MKKFFIVVISILILSSLFACKRQNVKFDGAKIQVDSHITMLTLKQQS